MDKKVVEVLQAYHDRIEHEGELMSQLTPKEGMARRDEFLLSVGEETGQFLNSFIKSQRPKTILEIGTSYGYSTIWLAEAARSVAGKVISLEIDSNKSNYAINQLKQANLDDVVDIRVGDALDQLRDLDEMIDFVLLDIWKPLYLPCFELFKGKLSKGAYVIADNIIHPPMEKEHIDSYINAIKINGYFDSVLIPIGSGLEVSRLRC